MSREPRRRARFFQWNDLHLRRPDLGAGGYPGANDKAAWALAAARGEVPGIEGPDFVLSAGDLIHGESDDFADDFAFLQRHLLAHLPVPLLPCVGNHENRQGEGLAAHNTAYDAFFGDGWHNYRFTVGGVAFVVVDTSGAHRAADAVTAARAAFVEGALEAAGDLPVILVSHVPLVAMRRPEALVPSFGFSSWKVVDGALWERLRRRADRVVAVLSGHLHLTAMRAVDGVHHVGPAGTAGLPADFAAFDLYDDRIEVRLHAAPAALLDASAGGDIHGRPRHAVDYTDADHPDHDSYLWGRPAERRFTIPLTGSRRPAASGGLEVLHESAPGRWQVVAPATPGD